MNKVILLILDGFGLGPAWGGNAITIAKMPNWKKWWQEYPHSALIAHGQAVGLPGNEIGNSEVGHLTIGAGRVIAQDSSKINRMIDNKTFFSNPALLSVYTKAKETNRPVHIMGLLSNGGVHASFNHLQALLEQAKQQNANKVYLHLFMDGRDTATEDGIVLLKKLEGIMRDDNVGTIATICGRYFAMDRDHRTDRTQKAIDCLVKGVGDKSNSPSKVLSSTYAQGKTDEFVNPTVIVDDSKNPVGIMKDGDPIIFFNFRSDRARQITEGLLTALPSSMIVTFIPYYKQEANKTHAAIPAFSPEEIKNDLSAVLSQNKVHQYHIAETEKYAHVTYFFNSGKEESYPMEDRELIPSPKVATYDLEPKMSAETITDKILSKLGKDYSFIVANYANADMVGHTGNLNASIQALEVLDSQLGKIIPQASKDGWNVVITADHGNVEEMVDPLNGAINPEHTRNPVPFLIIPPQAVKPYTLRSGGNLADIAPTILNIMGLNPSPEMTGQSLITQ